MKRILLYISIILATISCQNRVEPTEQQGETGQLNIQAVSVTTDIEELLAPRATRTTEGDTAQGGDGSENSLNVHILTITIADKASGKVVERYADHTAMPSTVVLKAGTYIITAQTADVKSQLPYNGKVGFSQPQYGATQEVTITSGEVSSVALACRQTTAGVTVDYSELFADLNPCTKPGETYRVRVFSSLGTDITFVKGEVRTAHFVVPSHEMLFFYQVSIDRVNKDGALETVTEAEPKSFDPAAMPVRKACNYNLTIKVLNQ